MATSLSVPRIAAGIEYDGSRFRGWQRQQPGVASIQAVVEDALAKVANHPLSVVCAGRTDAGVHASAQVIHFDSAAQRRERAWVLGANSWLPPEVNLLWARPMPEDFHARFAARWRRYRYVILNRGVRSSLHHHRATWCHQPLDAELMHRAGQVLLGEHDFSAYRAMGCQARSPMRCVHALDVWREGEFIYLQVTANAFLHHMVRNIAGVLMAIGAGDQPPDWAATVLASRDRAKGGVTAPATGLYLSAVGYDERFSLPTTCYQSDDGNNM